MISSEVQRTLVKSPPELWAELSDPTSLARHLGELGEIRITCTDPERAVEWQAEGISGTVLIKPSGWGTKVTLTVTRNVPEPQPPATHEWPARPTPTVHVEPEPMVQAQPDLTAQATQEPTAQAEAEPSVEAEHAPPLEAERTPEPPVRAERPESRPWVVPTVVPAAGEPVPEFESRRGFFSRLFHRRQRERPVEPGPSELTATDDQAEIGRPVEPREAAEIDERAAEPAEVSSTAAGAMVTEEPPDEPLAIDAPSPVSHETAAIDAPSPVSHETAAIDERTQSADGESADISAELRAAEEVTGEHVTAVLTGVLDRLGAAHHRPFSRS
jgi:hypothetical protein